MDQRSKALADRKAGQAFPDLPDEEIEALILGSKKVSEL